MRKWFARQASRPTRPTPFILHPTTISTYILFLPIYSTVLHALTTLVLELVLMLVLALVLMLVGGCGLLSRPRRFPRRAPSASAWLGVDHDGILLGAWLEVVEILPDFCQEERVILLVTDPESGLSACLWSYDPHVQHPCSGHSAFLWSREPHVQNSVRDANTPYLGHAHTPYLGHGDTSYLGHADNSRHIYIY